MITHPGVIISGHIINISLYICTLYIYIYLSQCSYLLPTSTKKISVTAQIISNIDRIDLLFDLIQWIVWILLEQSTEVSKYHIDTTLRHRVYTVILGRERGFELHLWLYDFSNTIGYNLFHLFPFKYNTIFIIIFEYSYY